MNTLASTVLVTGKADLIGSLLVELLHAHSCRIKTLDDAARRYYED